MKKIYALLFAATSVLSATAAVWDGTSTAITAGSGTESDPYLIETPQHMAWFAEQVNAGNTFENQYFKLTDNLELGKSVNLTFPMIGKFDTYTDGSTQEEVDNSIAFMGIFDGDFHKIDDFKVEYFDEELGGTGLFAVTRSTTIIKNLILGENSVINGELVCGAMVGQMLGGTILNCENRASVNGNMFTGGFVGCMEGGLVEGCINKGTIVGATEVGGIVGQGAYDGLVKACINTAPVTAIGFGGAGIAGALYDTFSLSNCYSIGAVTGQENPYMGKPHAIVSDSGFNNKVTNCYYVLDLCGYSDSKATAKTADEMKAADILPLLNNDIYEATFVADSESKNGGFPALAWQYDPRYGSVREVAVDDLHIAVCGNSIIADEDMMVFNLSGQTLAMGREVNLAKGCYLVRTAKGVTKVVIR